MPDLDPTPVPLYNVLWPYHADFDNMPIVALINRDMLINNSVNNIEEMLASAVGTQGTIANRINQSINPDGSLKVEAVDNTNHSIAAHTDGGGFVRMTDAERSKLALLPTDTLAIQFDSISTTPVFDSGTVEMAQSDTLSWRVEGNKVYGDLSFPAAAAHQHFYDMTPVPVNIITPDYINYKSTSVSTVYTPGTLRVFINGTRLSQSSIVYASGFLPSDPVKALTYTENLDGTFTMSAALSPSDVIRIDFDTTF